MPELRDIVLWMITASVGWAVLQVLRRGVRGNTGPLVQFSVLLGVAVWALVSSSPLAYGLASVGFLLAVVVPALLTSWAQRALGKEQVGLARRLMGLVAMLQPSRTTAAQHQLLGMLDEAREQHGGDLARAARHGLDAQLADPDPLKAREAAESLLALHCYDRRWAEAVQVFERHLAGTPPRAQVLPHLMRAYAEVGELDRALECYRELERQVQLDSPPEGLELARQHARLVLLSFGGEVAAIDHLAEIARPPVVEGALELPAAQAAYWRGVARLARRDPALHAEGVALLEQSERALAEEGADETARAAVAARLAEARRSASADGDGGGPAMAPETREQLAVLGRALQAEVRVAPPSRGWLRRLGIGPMVAGLVLANVLVWLAVEATGGSQDGWNLLRAGANFQRAVNGGQWWRLCTAIFLHIGVLHLAFNVFNLHYLGRLLEPRFGSGRLLFIYLASGLAGSLAGHVLNPATLSAGASGAVMGLLGAGIALFLRARDRQRATVAGQPSLMGLVFLAVVQVIFGLSVPYVDNAAHLGGLVSGFVLGLALVPAPAVASAAAPHRDRPGVVLGGISVLVMVLAAAGLAAARGQVALGLDRFTTHRSAGLELEAPAVWMATQSKSGLVLRDGPQVLVHAGAEPAASESPVAVLEAAGETLRKGPGGARAASDDGKTDTLELTWIERPHAVPALHDGESRAEGLAELTASRGWPRRARLRLRMVLVRQGSRDAVLLLRYPPAALSTYAAAFDRMVRSLHPQVSSAP